MKKAARGFMVLLLLAVIPGISFAAIMGYNTIGKHSGRIWPSAEVLSIWTAPGSGPLQTAYLYHNGTAANSARICVYLDDGDNDPDSGDTKVACSGVISSSTTEWASASFSSGLITAGSNYWVILASSSQDWYTTWEPGNNYGHDGGNNIYANAPSTLPATGNWGTLKRYYSGYVTVESSVDPPPVAQFSGTPASGSAPLDVAFTDSSTGTISTWSWNFGDGGTSTAQSPSHTYTAAGTYTVSLTVTGTGGSDTDTKTNYINVTTPALVSLSLSPSSVVGGDVSTGTVTLNVPAPSGGAVVSLSSSNTSVAGVPPDVTVGSGSTSATFSVGTAAVSSTTAVTISALYDGVTKSSPLTVVPAGGSSATMGYDTVGANSGRIWPSAEVLSIWTAPGSGPLQAAYLYHNGTAANSARICVYLDDGDNDPDSGDTKVACSGVISSSTTEWASASFSSGLITAGSNYWVILASSSQDWYTTWDSGGNYGHDGGNNIYANEPSTLPAAGNWGTLNRYYSGYVTIESSPLPEEYYVAVGDSITFGYNDNFPQDDTSLDGRNTGGGYEPILNNLLTAATGLPHTVVNVGVNDATSADGAVWISTTLSNHPSAKYYLVMYGTNDARFPAVPSGLGLNPGDVGYSGSYKDNMQTIVSAILAAGKTPYLAKVPYNSDPGTDILSIQDYNQVVDELIFDNDIWVIPPDYYTYFESNPGELGSDGIHPNGAGYQSMADLWFTALTTF